MSEPIERRDLVRTKTARRKPAPQPVAAALHRIRRARRISQKDLAARLYVHVQTVGKWERGEDQPGETQLHRWAAALGARITVMEDR